MTCMQNGDYINENPPQTWSLQNQTRAQPPPIPTTSNQTPNEPCPLPRKTTKASIPKQPADEPCHPPRNP